MSVVSTSSATVKPLRVKRAVVAAMATAAALGAGVAGLTAGGSPGTAPLATHATPAELAQYALPDPVFAKYLQLQTPPPAPVADPMYDKSLLGLGGH
jgi:hypothetical protein